jgi:hypothetical protein
VLENNIQEKSESNFTIRHDGFNTIRNIMFIDSGGITVSGDSNAITDNYHQNSDNSDSLPLAVRKGGIETMHFYPSLQLMTMIRRTIIMIIIGRSITMITIQKRNTSFFRKVESFV